MFFTLIFDQIGLRDSKDLKFKQYLALRPLIRKTYGSFLVGKL